MLGAIEAGGTKFICGIGTGPEDLRTMRVETSTPDATLSEVVRFFQNSPDPIRAIGIGSFGPVDLRANSATFGHITSTPKPGWRNFNLVGTMSRFLKVPVGFDTDVGAAALGEARWGAAYGFTDFLYLTVGTGIGGGAVVNGSVVHGMMHPEMGHIRVPHDCAADPFPGTCPFHGDCLEGLASGPAMEARWGLPAEQLPPSHKAWELEAHYIALGLVAWICTLSPQRIILGGGVMCQPQLYDRIRGKVAALLNGYIPTRELMESMDHYIVPPKLNDQAGVLGSLVLAERALGGSFQSQK